MQNQYTAPHENGLSCVYDPEIQDHRSMGQLWDALASLSDAITCALEGHGENARQHMRSAHVSLTGKLADENAASPGISESVAVTACKGGLAPWQVRRVTTYIDARLGEAILCEDLARLVGLSLSHFMRAFRDSFGHPPHAFLIRRRMERVQGLMLTTDSPLSQIALDCGLADQSHLSRLFQRLVGESPAAWRRARVTAET